MLSSAYILISLIPHFVNSSPLASDPFTANFASKRGHSVAAYAQTTTLASTTFPTHDDLPLSPANVFVIPPPQSASAQQSEVPSGSRPLVMAYYPDWVGPSFPPEKIDFKRIDWIDFAFAVPDQHLNLTWDNPDVAPNLLCRLVSAAHLSGKKVKLSVGGWTGSKYFSLAVSTDPNRQTLATNILCLYNQFSLDGIELDWEYPGHEGNTGNFVDPNDTANFLLFLQLLRATLPAVARITAATQTSPFVDAHQQPLTDVSEFATVLDWVLLMNYDVWGSSETPGPNAPLYDGCKNSTQPDADAVAAFKAWTSAGFPAEKLVLGVPSYGYISKSSATTLRTRSTSGPFTRHLPRSAETADDAGTQVPAVSADGSNQIQFTDLVGQGVLVPNGAPTGPKFIGGAGFTRYWDQCSATPFLRSESAGQVITYDDPESLGMKAAFARQVGMLGVNLFDVRDTDLWELTDAVRSGLEVN